MRKQCARRSSKTSYTTRAKVFKDVVTKEARGINLDVYIHHIFTTSGACGRSHLLCADAPELNIETCAIQPTSCL